MKGWRAIVLGGTGATGRELVRELIESPKWSRITLINRRQADEFQSDKVEQVVVNMDEMEQHADSFKDHDVAFCTFGTTRKDAGSAEAFVKIDHGYTVKFGSLCKDHGVKHFHLLTSMGSNPNSWFLYPKTKGQNEEDIKEMDFARTTIWRPGLLGRGDKARLVEKLAKYVSSEMPVARLAHAMRLHAEHILENDESPKVEIFGNKEINAIAKE